MATTYNTAFGSLPGYNEMLGTTNTTGGGQQQTYGQTTQTSTTRPPYQAAQTFAQMQRQGVARPAPPQAPQAQPFAQYGGSQQAQQMRQRLQEQLQQFGQAPSRFDTQAFQQIRGAQAANLQQEYQGQLKALNEEMARRGLSASSVGGGRMGDLAGQQARALASLDAELLQRAAETQAQDRAQLLSASQGLAELASAQDLAQFEANRVAQAATFENQLRAAQFGQQQFEQMGQEAFQGAQAEQAADQFARQFGLQATGQAAELSMNLQRLLGQQEMERAQLTGELEGADTLAARQFESQRELERAQLTGQIGEGATAQDTLAARQFALQKELQRAGLTGRLGEGATAQDTLAAQQQQFQQRQLLYQQAQQMSQQSGVQYTVDENNRVVPLRDAQGNVVRTSDFTQAAEARKLQSEELTLRRQLGVMEATGQGLTVDTEGRLIPATGTGAQTLQARQLAFQNAARLSEQSGVQYTVKDDGTVDVLRDAQGNPVRTSAFTQADETRKQQETLTKLDINLRRQLGLTEATGQMYNIDPNTGFATTVAGGDQTVESRRVAAQERQMAIQSAMQLSEQSGIQHEVKTDGTVGPMRDASGQPMRTSALTQASLDRALREQLGLMEATGQAYTRDAAGTVSLATGAQAARTIQAQQLAFQRAAQLSEQSGIQHEVKADGTVAPLIVNNQPVRTSAESRFNLDLQFRRQMGLMEQTGQAFNIDPATGRATLATGAEALSTLGRLQQNLQNAQIMSQITGRQYTVNDKGELVPAGDKTLATEQARQFDLEQQLRRQLGLTEASGYIYEIGEKGLDRTTQETVQGQIARSQTLLALAGALGNLTPEQIAQLLGRGVATTTQGGDRSGTPTTSSAINPKDGDTKMEGGKTYVYRGTWPNGQWVETGSATTTTTGDTKPTQPTTTTTRAPDTPTTLPALIRGYAPDGTTIIEYKPGTTMEWNGQWYRNIAGTNNWIPLS